MNREVLKKITYLCGDEKTVEEMSACKAREPFNEDVIAFLAEVSKKLMNDNRSREYSDVVTFAFWIREASINAMKKRYSFDSGYYRFGRGTAFHIAPSNVPVNFAYSLAVGLITGNNNIVRVPSKDFPQVEIIRDAFCRVIDERGEDKTEYPKIALIRYGRDKEINDELSSVADIRVIWGGDSTISEIRKSQLPPRSKEITFADRYSIAVIDSDAYIATNDKKQISDGFFIDTYFSDQNACTSPRIVIWTGTRKEEAKDLFWRELHNLVKNKYQYQDIMGVDKISNAYELATKRGGTKILPHEDNLLVRVSVDCVDADLMDFKGNSGFFLEYDCNDIMELKKLCDDKRCQTVGVIGETSMVKPLLESGVRGIDRVVPVGKTMDFDLVWDGYDLVSEMTRVASA